MERLKLIQQIHSRLGKLEADREESRIADKPTEQIDVEMTELRKKLEQVMNSPCPVIRDTNH